VRNGLGLIPKDDWGKDFLCPTSILAIISSDEGK